MSRGKKGSQKQMKQISVSVPDYIYKALVFLTETSGKSQSAYCAPWIENGVIDEISRFRKLQNEMNDLEISLEDEE